MTIETRSANSSVTKSFQQQQQQQHFMATSSTTMSKQQLLQQQQQQETSSNGYPTDTASDEDGFYTSAVSVQHKLLTSEHHLQQQHQHHHQEISSEEFSSSESEQVNQYGRKVVWPAWNVMTTKEGVITDEVHHHHLNGNAAKSEDQVDHPLGWMREAATQVRDHEIQRRAEQMEREIQKRTFDITKSNRLSRSRSRSNQIMERARSFDRMAAETHSNPNSRPPSRAGRRHRSPSLSGHVAEYWQSGGSRPQSRGPDFEPPQRWLSVGKLDTSQWESRIRDASPQAPRLGQAPRRRAAESPVPPALNHDDVCRKTDFPRGHVNNQWPPPPPPPPQQQPAQQQQQQQEATPPPPPPPPLTSSDLSSETVRRLCDEEHNKEQIVQEWVRQTNHHHLQQHHHVQQHKQQHHHVVEDEDLELQKFAYDIAETLVTNFEKSAGLQTKASASHEVTSTSTVTTEQSSRKIIQSEISQHQEQQQMMTSATFSGLVHATPAEARLDEEDLHEEVDRRNREKLERQKKREEIEKKERQMREEEERKLQEEKKQKQREEKKRKEEEIRRVREEEERKIKEEHARRMEEERRKQQQQQQQQQLQQQQQQHRSKRFGSEERRIRFEDQHKDLTRRSVTPQLTRKLSFDCVDDAAKTSGRSHEFTNVRTGHVDEKRSFWIRSTSTERLNARHETSPGPRRRILHQQEWIRAPNESGESLRPGSSLGQVGADQGTVKQAVSSFSQLSKSKSSAAVLQANKKMSKAGQSSWIREQKQQVPEKDVAGHRLLAHQEVRTNQVQDTRSGIVQRAVGGTGSGRTTPSSGRQPAVLTPTWCPTEQTQQEEQRGLRYEDVQTYQVQNTIHELGKKSGDSGRTTPVPSRHIAEVFAENKIGTEWKVKQHQQQQPEVAKPSSSASPWRSAAPSTATRQPELKLVNVTVEKSATGGANIHISENAQAQMESFMKSEIRQKEAKFATTASTSMTTMTSSSSTSSSSQKTMIMESSNNATKLVQVPPKSPGPSRSTKVAGGASNVTKEKSKVSSDLPQQPRSQVMSSRSESKSSKHVKIEEIVSTESEKKSSPTPTLLPQSTITNATTVQPEKTQLTAGSLPMPVTQSWFEYHEQQQQQQHQQRSTTTMTSSGSVSSEEITPLPVLAGWFVEEKQKEQQQQQKTEVHHQQQQEIKKTEQKQQQQQQTQKWSREHKVEVQQQSQQKQQQQKWAKEQRFEQIKKEQDQQKQQQLQKQQLQEQQLEFKRIEQQQLEQVAIQQQQQQLQQQQQQQRQEISIDQQSSVEVNQTAAEIEAAMKGKVRENIAMFKQQQQQRFSKSPSGENIVESMKGKVGESRRAYIQRASSSDREDTERKERARELEAILRARNESGAAPGSEDPEKLFAQRQKEERERELREVAQLRATTIAHNLWEETDASERVAMSKQQRARELQELRPKKNWNDIVSSGRHAGSDEDDAELELLHPGEAERLARARELQELAKQRQDWTESMDDTVSHSRLATRTPDPDLDEARMAIRSAAMVWQERDRVHSRSQDRSEQVTTPTPSRRIGNLFSRSSDHWLMQDGDEEFPAPPSSDDVIIQEPPSSPLPAPPPRESSRDVMMEYRGNRSKH